MQQLNMLHEYGVCALSHLIWRFRPEYRTADPKKAWSIQSAEYRRFHQLAQASYICVKHIPALNGRGSGPSLVCLGPEGARVLAEYLKVPRSDIPYQVYRVDSAYFGAHALVLAEVHLALELACEQTPGVTLAEWVPERQLRTPPIVKVEDPKPPHPIDKPPLISLIPDGAFRLQLANGSSQGYRLEIDLTGSTAAKRQRAKLRAYLAHARDDCHPVLWVVPTPAIARLLTERCQAEAAALGADPTLFWITTRERIREETILTPIWSVVGVPTAMALIPPREAQGGSSWRS